MKGVIGLKELRIIIASATLSRFVGPSQVFFSDSASSQPKVRATQNLSDSEMKKKRPHNRTARYWCKRRDAEAGRPLLGHERHSCSSSPSPARRHAFAHSPFHSVRRSASVITPERISFPLGAPLELWELETWTACSAFTTRKHQHRYVESQKKKKNSLNKKKQLHNTSWSVTRRCLSSIFLTPVLPGPL